MSTELLSVKNLSVSFGSVQAVRDLSFSIEAGTCLGIVGESGSGKSVSSLAIMRLLDKRAKVNGEILFKDCNLLLEKERSMRSFRGNKIAMVFQEPMTSLNPVLTCGFQVAEAIRLHQNLSKELARKKAIELFLEVELPRPDSIFDSYPHQLSGGQRQRVMIAMAISCNPELLIADEPTTALDVTVQKSVVNLLRGLMKSRQMGLLFISHDLALVAELADNVLVMYKGDVVEQGSAKEVLEQPQQAYTKGLVACRPSIAQPKKRLLTVQEVLEGKTIDESYRINEQERKKRQEEIYDAAPILDLKGVSVDFPIKTGGLFAKTQAWVHALDNIDLSIYKGESLGIVGESGSGKTTLGRSILRLQSISAGSIFYGSNEISRYSERQMRPLRKALQIIFQDPYSSLNPKMRIGDAILEPMQVYSLHKNGKGRKERVLYLLDKVGLGADFFGRYPHELSGGQRQRVCIARALALEPEFIVCDESVSALDVSVQAQVLNLLADLKEEFQLTYLFITHDLSVVSHFCDRVVVMQKGKIVEQALISELIKAPQESYTKALLAAVPEIGVS